MIYYMRKSINCKLYFCNKKRTGLKA